MIADGIEAGRFPFRPGELDRGSFDHCRSCDFDAVCPTDRDDFWQSARDDERLAAYVALVEPEDAMSEMAEVDEATRQAIRTQLDETLFVEAGAGTGKTSELVKRVLALVENGLTPISDVAAITFTEAAAADLRRRIHDELVVLAPNTFGRATHSAA